MASIVVTRRIAATLEKTWSVFIDLEANGKRIPGIKSMEILEGPGSPAAVGTRWRETRVMMGREATEVMWVSDAVEREFFKVEAESHGCHYTTHFRFRPKDGGTEVEIDFAAEPLTLAAKLMSPMFAMMKDMVRKCLEADLDALQAVCESGD